MKKAIITGATGGLGINLVNYLKDKDIEVIACGRNEEIGKELGVSFRGFDLSDEHESIKNFEHTDVVFHCAALSSPWGKYEDFYKCNIEATKNVIKAMKKHKIKKLVFVSSPSVYFEFFDHFDIKESYKPKKFVNFYAQTKYEAEKVVLDEDDLQAVIIRPRAIFGEFDSVLVPRLEKVSNKGFLPLIKNKDITIDVTYVGNVVYALYLAATKEIPNKMIFNITNDENMNIKDIFSLLLSSLDKKCKFKYVNYRTLMMIAKFLEFLSHIKIIKEPALTQYSVGVISHSQTLDITLAKEVLGYKPIYSIKEGVQRYAKYRNI